MSKTRPRGRNARGAKTATAPASRGGDVRSRRFQWREFSIVIAAESATIPATNVSRGAQAQGIGSHARCPKDLRDPVADRWDADGAASSRRRTAESGRTGGFAARQSAGQGDEPLSSAARAQPGRLVSVGRGGAGPGPAREEADFSLDRLFELLLVPRDGTRIVHGRRSRRKAEQELRVHQGRSRG